VGEDGPRGKGILHGRDDPQPAMASRKGLTVKDAGRILLLAVSLLALLAGVADAQQWAKTYGGARYGQSDLANSIHPTVDEGYIVAGGAFPGAAWVMKLNGDSTVAWRKTYRGGGARDGWFTSLHPMADGGYIVAGVLTPFGAGMGDFWVLKLNGEGAIVWQKTYGGPHWDRARSIRPTADGGYIVAGETTSFGAGVGEAWVLKLNSDGAIAWQKTYGGPGRDWAWSVQPTPDGGMSWPGELSSLRRALAMPRS
jgi:hypothetical protein